MLRPDSSRDSGKQGRRVSPDSSTRRSSTRSLSTSINTPEIHKDELIMEACVLGQGTFGLVRRGKWKNITVAVKEIHTKDEIATFTKEVETLSRVHHPNIVQLFGASIKEPCCLVMEYADGGSLYDVIHPPKDQRIVDYTLAHALSWCHQTSDGVAYLHSLKLVHRDLKPPNLLLVDQGLKVKICDFGTACDVRTHMTTTQGSAAWMAPEVFTSNNYSEKCDVHSFGIILWEVLSRKKPFGDTDGPSFAIMWAVQQGKRPPLLSDCPKEIESLMVNCWAPDPSKRPNMALVKEKMAKLVSVFTDKDLVPVLPLERDMTEQEIFLSNGAQTEVYGGDFVSTEPVFPSGDNSDLYNFLNHSRVIVPFSEPRNVSRENLLDESLYHRRKSMNEGRKTPTSRRRSGSFDEAITPGQESTPRKSGDHPDGLNPQFLLKSRSFDDSSLDSDLQSPLRVDVSPPGVTPSNPFPPVIVSRPTNFGPSGHFLQPTNFDRMSIGSNQVSTNFDQQQRHQVSTNFDHRHHVYTNFDQQQRHQVSSDAMFQTTSLGHHRVMNQRLSGDDNRNFFNDPFRPISPSMRGSYLASSPGSPSHPSIPDFNDPNLNITVCIDPNLRPLQPDPNEEESLNIYRRHVQESNNYLRIKAELSLLIEREKELLNIKRDMRGEIKECPNVDEEFERAHRDKEELVQFKNNLEIQVKKIEQKKQQEEAARDGFVLISKN